MTDAETVLEMAQRHVREGKARVARQCALVARLRAGDHPTDQAERLLAEFEAALREHEAHLAWLTREQQRRSS